MLQMETRSSRIVENGTALAKANASEEQKANASYFPEPWPPLHESRLVTRESNAPGLQSNMDNATAAQSTAIILQVVSQRIVPMLSMLGTRWHRWTPPEKIRKDGLKAFLKSASLFEWVLLLVTLIIVFPGVQVLLSRCAPRNNTLALVSLMLVAMLYTGLIWTRFGRKSGENWLCGWILETIFLIENIFVFQIIVRSFRIPSDLTRKILQIVVGFQIFFEFLFFMGLAAYLRQFKALPYLLGAWLIVCGVQAAREDVHEDFDMMDTWFFRSLRNVFGRERVPEGNFSFRAAAGPENPKASQDQVLFIALGIILLADFFLEIDVVLTKIETIENTYISFSSSAVAALAIPELFVFTDGLLHEFHLLKYGIACVFFLFGGQMVLHTVVDISAGAACALVVGVLAGSVVFSVVHKFILGGGTPARQLSLR